MPVDAWILLVFAVGIGLALELVFYAGQRARRGPSEGGPHAAEDEGHP